MTREEKINVFAIITACVTLILVMDVAWLWWHHWNLRTFVDEGFFIFTMLNGLGLAAINVLIVLVLMGGKKAE